MLRNIFVQNPIKGQLVKGERGKRGKRLLQGKQLHSYEGRGGEREREGIFSVNRGREENWEVFLITWKRGKRAWKERRRRNFFYLLLSREKANQKRTRNAAKRGGRWQPGGKKKESIRLLLYDREKNGKVQKG